jgi:uncharacterized protein (DUF4415 family)
MPIIRKTLAQVRKARFTRKELARLDAMTDAQITAAAKADPDNPPITAAEFARMRRPGRPPLPPQERKESVTIRIDPAVINYFRSSGRGWQTRIGAVLSGHVKRRR